MKQVVFPTRERVTKTMSILDRLEKLTLPNLSDVESGLEKYLEQKEKAERFVEVTWIRWILTD